MWGQFRAESWLPPPPWAGMQFVNITQQEPPLKGTLRGLPMCLSGPCLNVEFSYVSYVEKTNQSFILHSFIH
jgi:hypothetical protein